MLMSRLPPTPDEYEYSTKSNRSWCGGRFSTRY